MWAGAETLRVARRRGGWQRKREFGKGQLMSDVNAGEISAEGTRARSWCRAWPRSPPSAPQGHPSAGLMPFARRHVGDALAAGFFLLFDRRHPGPDRGVQGRDRQGLFRKGPGDAVNNAFIGLAAVALALAAARALRFFFVTRQGERVAADLRKCAVRPIADAGPGRSSSKTRTGEVLSRLTTDIAIVENLLGALGLGGPAQPARP